MIEPSYKAMQRIGTVLISLAIICVTISAFALGYAIGTMR